MRSRARAPAFGGVRGGSARREREPRPALRALPPLALSLALPHALRYVEYLGNVEPDKRDALVATLQQEFAAVVAEAAPTSIEMMPRDAAERELNRTAQNFDFSMFPEPTIRIFGCAGCLGPCGGTHVRSTADLGEYTVTGLRVKKGVVRVKYGLKGKEAK